MEDIRLLYIDLFCGAGGTSTGVEKATYQGRKCAKVIACVNHDANAIASHAANHPEAVHYTEDIRTLELTPMVEHLKRMRAKYPVPTSYYGQVLNARISAKLKVACQETLTAGHWLNTSSAILRR